MELPANVTASKLYALVAQDGDLLFALKAMRKVVEALAQTTNATVPSYTDHTVRHMDALWAVSDEIITEPEIARMTSAEAFLLGAAFYLHDIGNGVCGDPRRAEKTASVCALPVVHVRGAGATQIGAGICCATPWP